MTPSPSEAWRDVPNKDTIVGLIQNLPKPIESWVSLNPCVPAIVWTEHLFERVGVGTVNARLQRFEFRFKISQGGVSLSKSECSSPIIRRKEYVRLLNQ